jgi:glycosyltransferase involved in cell wall biosynthesis
LQSLLDQQDTGWRLLWRDDGSSDRSAELVEAFAQANPGRVSRLRDPPARLGVAAAFHALACAAPPETSLAFCDQDDVWLPEKLTRARTALAAIPAGTPALYASRQILVDATLRPIGRSPALRRPPDFAMALTQNLATGCTVILNPAVAALFRAAPPPSGSLHDWWCYILVMAAGGELIFDDTPSVLYRQHAANVIGAPASRPARALAALRRGPAPVMALLRTHLATLLAHPELLTPDALQTTRGIDTALREGPSARIRALRHHNLRRQTSAQTALFALWFLSG